MEIFAFRELLFRYLEKLVVFVKDGYLLETLEITRTVSQVLYNYNYTMQKMYNKNKSNKPSLSQVNFTWSDDMTAHCACVALYEYMPHSPTEGDQWDHVNGEGYGTMESSSDKTLFFGGCADG